MNTEKVAKALNCCTNWKSLKDCGECPYFEPLSRGNCIGEVLKGALKVIDELQAHNETLQKENKYLRERLAEEMEHAEDTLNKSQ